MLGIQRNALIGAMAYQWQSAGAGGGAGGGAGTRTASTQTANGQAAITSSQFKYGSGALQLDGTGDYVVSSVTTDTASEFTWETWFRVDVDAGGGTVAILSNRSGSFGNGDIMMLFRNFDMKVQVNAAGGTAAFNANGVGNVLGVDQWHHFAFARDNSNNVAVWVNGSRVANGTWDGAVFDNGSGLGIGAHSDGGIPANSGTTAWIDEVRISTSDRYGVNNTTIAPPASQFTNDADTKLLLHFDTDLTDDVTGAGAGGGAGGGAAGGTYTVRADSNQANIQLAIPFANISHIPLINSDISSEVNTGYTGQVIQTGGESGTRANLVGSQKKWSNLPDYLGSVQFDQTGSTGAGGHHALAYEMPTSTGRTGFGNANTSSYTLEVWAKATNGASNNNWALSSSDNGGRWLFGINTSATITFGQENNIGLGDTDWHHIAIVNNNGAKSLYIDSSYRGSWYSTNTGFNVLYVGQFSATGGGNFQGYMQDLRVYDFAKYNGTSTNAGTNFTVPLSIIQSIP